MTREQGAAQSTARPHAFRILQFCVVALALGWMLGRSGLFSKVEQHVLDFWATVAPADGSMDRVAIVRITENDYRTIFAGRRPLDADALQRLIKAIATHRPLAIGVDVDTSSTEWDGVHVTTDVPIAWARDARFGESGIESISFLGSRPREATASAGSGLGLIVANGQGVARTYQRWFPTSHGLEPSFTCAIVQQCTLNPACTSTFPRAVAGACTQDAAGTESRVIGYRRAFALQSPSPFFTAGEVLASVDQPPGDRDQWHRAFSGRIVLVGGTFPASGDAAHATPLGLLPGVEVMAHILTSELRGGGARPSRPIVTAVVLVFETYLILLIGKLPRRRAVPAGAGLLLALGALLSLFNEGGLWRTPYFVLVLAGILGLQLSLQIVARSQRVFVEAVEASRHAPAARRSHRKTPGRK